MVGEHKLTAGDYYYGRFPVDENGVHKCPVCEQYIFKKANSDEICEVCAWQDNSVQESDPDWDGSANDISLNQAREYWREYKKPIR